MYGLGCIIISRYIIIPAVFRADILLIVYITRMVASQSYKIFVCSQSIFLRCWTWLHWLLRKTLLVKFRVHFANVVKSFRVFWVNVYQPQNKVLLWNITTVGSGNFRLKWVLLWTLFDYLCFASFGENFQRCCIFANECFLLNQLLHNI